MWEKFNALTKDRYSSHELTFRDFSDARIEHTDSLSLVLRDFI